MAAAKVFDTYELLEDILLHLPLRQLLLVQRVSKPFRQLAQNSLGIQKALFLTPATNKTAKIDQGEREDFFGVWAHPEDDTEAIILLNPFIELLVPDRTLPPRRDPSGDVTTTTIRYRSAYNLFEPVPVTTTESGQGRAIKLDYEGVRWNFALLQELSGEASINTMLMTDPPIIDIQVSSFAQVGEDAKWYDTEPCYPSSRHFKFLRITDLRDFVGPSCHQKHAVHHLERSFAWLPLPKGYDTTGWEMLCLLATEGEERKAVLHEMYLAQHPTEVELISTTRYVSPEEHCKWLEKCFG